MAKHRVHIECSKTLPKTNSVYSRCIAYIVDGDTEGIARAKAVQMARDYYPGFDAYRVYHTENVPEGETNDG